MLNAFENLSIDTTLSLMPRLFNLYRGRLGTPLSFNLLNV